MTELSVAAQLAAPFPPEDIHWKPGAVSGSKALVMAYLNARAVMDRLDEVLGAGGWHDDYQMLDGGSVMCRLTAIIDDRSVTKADVGSQSEQPDVGDRLKAAFSDALKRAAVKFGIGRYLYSLPHQWVDYDPQRKRLVGTPKLPAWALPPALPKHAQPNQSARPDNRDEAEVITSAEAAEMERMLGGAGKTVSSAMIWLKKPGDAKVKDLTVDEWRRLMQAMSPRQEVA